MADDIQELFEYIRVERAIDFSACRMNPLRRRLQLRLSATGASDYASYRNFLSVNPGELTALIDALTIKISHFFRNPLVFEILLSTVLPRLLESCKRETLRIWCGGCARGEEAYSLAILLKELADKEELQQDIFIIGTDIDRDALADAERAVYRAEALTEVKKGHLDRYFTVRDGAYEINPEVRSMVTFAYHDVTTGMPPKEGIFSDYHLVLCRNVLIYFNADLQESVLTAFSRLQQSGDYLVLGEAESMPVPLTQAYSEIIPRTKIFRKGGPKA